MSPPRSSDLARRPSSALAHLTPDERLALLGELRAHLVGPHAGLTPTELLRCARLVPGWSVVRGDVGRFDVSTPTTSSLRLTREALVALLKREWITSADEDAVRS